jgi:aryl-alcohol dehydrogenase-like predicted oxidoreductase
MNTKAHTRRLGETGPQIFPLALGCMGMSDMYGQASDDEGVATIHEAIERGINLLDTGDFYGMGHNELLVRRAIQGGSIRTCPSKTRWAPSPSSSTRATCGTSACPRWAATTTSLLRSQAHQLS